MPLELLKIKADKSQFCATSCTHIAIFFFIYQGFIVPFAEHTQLLALSFHFLLHFQA